MPVYKDFSIDIDPSYVLDRLSKSRPNASPDAWQDVIARALDEAGELVHPRLAYAVFPVVRAEESRLIIDGGKALESKVVASLFAKAPEVVLMLWTIGPDLEARVAEHGASGDFPASFALDVMGSVAVDQAGRAAWDEIQTLARGRGVKASIPLNPGTTHWPMSGQRLIAELVQAENIGVGVTASDILRPFKSLAYAVALGNDVLTPENASSCDYCDNRDLCRG